MRIPFLLPFLSLLLLAEAYTWNFTSQPRQCEDVTIALQGSGRPPYTLLIVPVGSTPLPNDSDVRQVQIIPFSGLGTTFKLNFPKNSSFIAVVSDSSGFGSGGASIPVPVFQSSDSSCFNASEQGGIAWVFYNSPIGGLAQCETSQLWWESDRVVGTPYFHGVIPGGTVFLIPQGPLFSYNANGTTPNGTSYNVAGTAFNWTVDMAPGTEFILVGSDDRGFGSGGSAEYVISSTPNSSCLNSNSPSSSSGSLAGSYPTGISSQSTSNGGHSSSSSTGAIVGGVVAGAVLSGILVGYVRRRRPYAKERPVIVFQDDEDEDEQNHNLPQHYVPEPFVFPLPAIGGMYEATSSRDGLVSMTMADIQRLQTPRKSAPPPQLRSVNIIQHDDAGPGEGLSGHSQSVTIELPPAYTNLRQTQDLAQDASFAASSPTSTTSLTTADSDS